MLIYFPTLMEAPTKRSVIFGSLFSVIASILVTMMYLIFDESYANLFFGLILAILIIHIAFSYYWFHGNHLIFFRYFLLFIPIFITVLAWWLWNGDVLTAPFGQEFQTVYSTSLLVTSGFLSIMGCTSGWLFAFRYPACFQDRLKLQIVRNKKILLWVGIFLTITFGLLYVVQIGGIISAGKAYAVNGSNGRELGFDFGAFNIFQELGISLLVLTTLTFINGRLKIFIVILISLIMGMLAGSRADYLPPLLIISIYFLALRNQTSDLRVVDENKMLAKRVFLILLFGIFGFFMASGIAVWRASPELSIIDVASDIAQKGPELLLNDSYGHSMISIETGNMAIGGMYGLIENTHRNGFLLGETYFDYLLRSPPAFFGTNRPEDLAFRTGIGDVVMSQGGTFEPAEAYANFGLPGCFFVSFLLSYVMGVLLKNANKHGSIFFACFYLVYGLMGFREVWYQTFAYFRLGTIFLILYVFLSLFYPSLVSFKRSVIQSRESLQNPREFT